MPVWIRHRGVRDDFGRQQHQFGGRWLTVATDTGTFLEQDDTSANGRAGLARDDHQPRCVWRPHQVDHMLCNRNCGCARNWEFEDASRLLAAIQRCQPDGLSVALLRYMRGPARVQWTSH